MTDRQHLGPPAPSRSDRQAAGPLATLRHCALALSLGAGLLAPDAGQARTFEQAELQRPRASFVDIAALSAALRLPRSSAASGWEAAAGSALPRTDCEAQPHLPAPPAPMVIPGRYVSGGHGPVRPDYDAAVAPYREFERRVAVLANQYLLHGQARYARCLLQQLGDWADADALTAYTVDERPGASNQAWYQAEWSIAAAALALSQVVAEPTLDPGRLAQVIAWLQRASRKQISYPGGRSTCCNNHAYWRGLHATMVGVLANDPALYRWGLGRYALAIEHLAPAGTDAHWPLESARKELALHYHNFALLPLVLTAEIAAQQGLDLYAYRVDGRDLHSAVRYLSRSWNTPAAWPAQGLLPQQDRRAFTPGHGDQTWAAFYRARFGADPLGLLNGAEFNPRTGGLAALHLQPGARAAQPPAAALPRTAIDLRPWKLQLPDAKASEVMPEALLRGYRDPFFAIEPDGSLLFTAPVGGGTTANARYTRSELREMLDATDKSRNWTVHGKHTLRLRQAVLRAPRSGRVVVFQIHAIQPDGGNKAPPLVKAQWNNGRMEFLVKAQASGGADIRLPASAEVPLGSVYEAGLEVQDGRLTLRFNDITLVDEFLARDPAWAGLRFYFKAGNYPQDADASGGDNLSVVRIHALSVAHE